MRTQVSITLRKLFAPLLVTLLAASLSLGALWSMGSPHFWDFQISSYEQADRINPPKPGCIVFTGSSSIRFWHTLTDDMQPLDVINRGFGGAQISQVNNYAGRIVLPYRPRAVVLYAGDNDIAWPWSKSPATVAADFQEFVAIIHAARPETWIYFISLRPAPLGWSNAAGLEEINRLVAEFCRTQARVKYVDASSVLLDSRGQPRRELFRRDRLHMNAQGYKLWTAIIKPLLLSRFGPDPDLPAVK